MFCHEQVNYYENKMWIGLPNLKANKEKGGAFMSKVEEVMSMF